MAEAIDTAAHDGLPVARSAFHGLLVPSPGALAEAGVVVRERTEFAILFLAARNGQAMALRQAVAASMGLSLPEASFTSEHDSLAAISIGPDQWLLLLPQQRTDAIGKQLRAACDGLAALIDVGDGRGVIDVSGPRARDALAKGIAVDLHPSVFGPGRTASTMAALIDVTISRLDDVPTFRIILFRSLAGSFWHWLESAAAEFGLAVAPAA